MAEDLPEDFVPRLNEFKKLVSSLLDCEREDAIASVRMRLLLPLRCAGLAATETPPLPEPSAMTSAF